MCLVAICYLCYADYDFRELAKHVPEGCQFVMMMDNCNSAGLLDGSTEVIGDSHQSANVVKNKRQQSDFFKGFKMDKEPSDVLVSSCQSYESSVGRFIVVDRN
ncbi:putative Caspase-like domain-containing protein [Medicago truncatula]|uniref:Putative Caspase-like domain-containing protein n=1 Tax=Medicago truncatula TaxID=3880 RepID=A0A396HQX0_MEDTR|nr:putative Caspase-like domain-containing protein [Medicago truncatula]